MKLPSLTPARAFVAALALVGLVLCGCLETERTLGPRDASVVDRAYCGDWLLSRRDDKGQTQNTLLLVRNIDEKLYYVEWGDLEKPQDRSRMTAFTADVKGVPFAHCQLLGEDGQNSETYTIFRFELEDQKLVIKELNGKFFEGKIGSDAELRKLIEDNLENVAMYEGEPMIGTRQEK